MTVEEMENLFEKYNNDFSLLDFDKCEHPLKTEHNRRDLCAFVLLNDLVTSNKKIIGAAEHDQIWLDVDMEKLAEKIHENDIKFLAMCGVFIDEDSLSMFA